MNREQACLVEVGLGDVRHQAHLHLDTCQLRRPVGRRRVGVRGMRGLIASEWRRTSGPPVTWNIVAPTTRKIVTSSCLIKKANKRRGGPDMLEVYHKSEIVTV